MIEALFRDQEELKDKAIVLKLLLQSCQCIVLRLMNGEREMLPVLLERDSLCLTRIVLRDDTKRIHVHRDEGEIGIRDSVLFRKNTDEVFLLFSAYVREFLFLERMVKVSWHIGVSYRAVGHYRMRGRKGLDKYSNNAYYIGCELVIPTGLMAQRRTFEMKNIPIIAAVAAATIAFAVPAHAQLREPSANDWMRYDEHNCARDPGYCRAMSRSYNYSSDYYSGVVINNQDTTCILLLFCKTRDPNEPKAGQTCHDANGVLFGLDRKKRWYRVPGSESVNMNVTRVQASCPWSSYAAEGSSQPVAPGAASSAPYTGTSERTYIEGGYLITIKTDANGVQTTRREPINR